jgi:hypothetical protein
MEEYIIYIILYAVSLAITIGGYKLGYPKYSLLISTIILIFVLVKYSYYLRKVNTTGPPSFLQSLSWFIIFCTVIYVIYRLFNDDNITTNSNPTTIPLISSTTGGRKRRH